MWESHADEDDRRIVNPTLERARLVYTVNKPACVPADQVMAAFTTPSVGLGDLVALLMPHPVPTEMEIMLECLLLNALVLAPPPRTAITDIEIMLQRLLPGMPTRAPR